MAVNLLLVTHENIGQSMLDVLKQTLGTLPLATTVIPIAPDADIDVIRQEIQTVITRLAANQSVLILTDLFGATPCNLVLNCCENEHVKVITGLNFPMLLRTMNYAKLGLHKLAEKALSGGREGVMACNKEVV